jgi:hypothetical protein
MTLLTKFASGATPLSPGRGKEWSSRNDQHCSGVPTNHHNQFPAVGAIGKTQVHRIKGYHPQLAKLEIVGIVATVGVV